MLVRSGITLLKYWFSVSDSEQEARFRSRLKDSARRWKMSPMDLESRNRWVDFSRAKDEMFAHTNIPEAPWFTVEANDKRRARLNCIRHLLSKVPYEDMTPEVIELAPRKGSGDYQRPPQRTVFRAQSPSLTRRARGLKLVQGPQDTSPIPGHHYRCAGEIGSAAGHHLAPIEEQGSAGNISGFDGIRADMAKVIHIGGVPLVLQDPSARDGRGLVSELS